MKEKIEWSLASHSETLGMEIEAKKAKTNEKRIRKKKNWGKQGSLVKWGITKGIAV